MGVVLRFQEAGRNFETSIGPAWVEFQYALKVGSGLVQSPLDGAAQSKMVDEIGVVFVLLQKSQEQILGFLGFRLTDEIHSPLKGVSWMKGFLSRQVGPQEKRGYDRKYAKRCSKKCHLFCWASLQRGTTRKVQRCAASHRR